MKRAGLLVTGLALLALGWLLWSHRDPAPSLAPTAPRSSSTGQSPDPVSPPAHSSSPPALPPPTEASHLADDLNSPSSDIQADLRIVSNVLAAFRTNFPHNGNPTGTNAEITAALTGKNKLHLALIPPYHRAINRAGELCDRWGTPFFFHAESGTRMGLRSAGPDKKMWNDDDVVLAP
jgi:hypothetical protein